jgi:hypothetical protein
MNSGPLYVISFIEVPKKTSLCSDKNNSITTSRKEEFMKIMNEMVWTVYVTQNLYNVPSLEGKEKIKTIYQLTASSAKLFALRGNT